MEGVAFFALEKTLQSILWQFREERGAGPDESRHDIVL
jgi:hypothetical protein